MTRRDAKMARRQIDVVAACMSRTSVANVDSRLRGNDEERRINLRVDEDYGASKT